MLWIRVFSVPPSALWLPDISKFGDSRSCRPGHTPPPTSLACAKLTNLPFYFEPSLKAFHQFITAKVSAPPILKPYKVFLPLPSTWPHLIKDHPHGQVSVSVGASLCVWKIPFLAIHLLPCSLTQMWNRLFWLLFPLGGFRSRQDPGRGGLFSFIWVSLLSPWKLRCWVVSSYSWTPALNRRFFKKKS